MSATLTQPTATPGGTISGTALNFVPVRGYLQTSDQDIGLVFNAPDWSGVVGDDVSLGDYQVVLADADTQTQVAGTISIVESVVNDAAWYYGKHQDVENMLDKAGLSIIADLNDDNVEDAGLMQRDGNTADADFNVAMRSAAAMVGATFPVPITVGGVALPDLDDANETKVWFADRSARYVVKLLNRHRFIQYANGNMPAQMDKTILQLVGDPIAEIREMAMQGFAGMLVDGEKLVTPSGIFTSVPINYGRRHWRF